MPIRARRIKLTSGDEATPPTEILIFPFGKVDTLKGEFLFDRVAAKTLMAAWADYGNDLCFDYEHKSLNEENRAGDGKAAGWFRLELRKDGLWAVDIRWTDAAYEQIQAREWRYFSPTFEVDEKTDRIVFLLNIALTNIPATKNLQPLVPASAIPYGGEPVVDQKWDAEAAVERVAKWASSDGSGGEDTIKWSRYAKAFAWCDPKMADSFEGYRLPHHDIVDEKLVTVRKGVTAAGAALQSGSAELSINASDVPKIKAHIAAHYHQMGLDAPWETKAMAIKNQKSKPAKLSASKLAAKKAELVALEAEATKLASDAEEMDADEMSSLAEEALGLAQQALKAFGEGDIEESEKLFAAAKEKMAEAKKKDPDADGDDDEEDPDEDEEGEDEDMEEESLSAAPIKTQKSGASKLLKLARELTGKSSYSEIAGALRAQHAAIAQVEDLSKQVKQMQRQTRKDRVVAMLDAAVTAMKITPAQRPALLRMGLSDPDELKGFLDASPRIVQTAIEPGDGVTAPTTLTRDELAIAKAFGTVDQYTKLKADAAKQGKVS